MSTTRVTATRGGLSLLEIIVALGVLAGSAVILSQMVDVGSRHALRSREITDAQTAAHNLLSEFLSGERPLAETTIAEPIDQWSPWDYTVTVAPVGVGDLVAVSVVVLPRRDRQPNAPTAPAAVDARLASLDRQPAYRLTRWIRQPSLGTDESFDVMDELTTPATGSPTP